MDHQRYLDTRHFGSLDALRCLAIVAVVWHHATGSGHALALLAKGRLGVHLFFVISGFLITTLLLRERDRHGRISLKHFYMRRTLRIFPLYYTVLAIYLLMVVVLERHSAAGSGFLGNLPAFLTYTSNWFVTWDSGRVIFYLAWSLATEEQFYLTWPWIERFWPKRGWLLALPTLLALDLLVHCGALQPLIPAGSLLETIIASLATPILLGVGLAHILHHPRGFAVLAPIAGHRLMSPVAFALVLAALSAPVHGHASELLSDVSFFWLVAACVTNERHALAGVMRWRPVVWIGKISYGIYLIQLLCLNAAMRLLGAVGVFHPVANFAVAMLGAVLVASLSYRYFESYFLRRRDRYRSPAE